MAPNAISCGWWRQVNTPNLHINQSSINTNGISALFELKNTVSCTNLEDFKAPDSVFGNGATSGDTTPLAVCGRPHQTEAERFDAWLRVFFWCPSRGVLRSKVCRAQTRISLSFCYTGKAHSRDLTRQAASHGYALSTHVRGVAQPGRAPGSGPGGRRFKSSLPDHIFNNLQIISKAIAFCVNTVSTFL